MNNLKDKVIVITGGAGVLGSDFAKELAKKHAKVAILDLNVKRAKELANELNEQGFNTIGVEANVLSKDSLVKAKKEVNEKFGTIDILINGAGGNHPKATTTDEFFNLDSLKDDNNKTFFDLDLDSFNFVFGLNFTGTLLPTQVFSKDLLNKEGASILNISSMNAFKPLTKIPAYSAAKAAISNFTEWLAVHFAKVNVRVNAIAPGFFSTEQNKTLLWNSDGTPTDRTKKILNNTPMGRFGEAHELIGTLMWLLDSNASGFVTGIVVPVDGGFSAYSGV